MKNKRRNSNEENVTQHYSNDSEPKESSIFKKIKTVMSGLGIATIGILLTIAIPVWQIYFVETAKIKMEIASVHRFESDSPNILLSTDELEQLELYIPETLLYEYNKQGKRGDKLHFPKFSISVLLKAFDKAKQDIKNIADINNSLREYQIQIQKFINGSDDEYQLEEFRIANLKGWHLSRYIEDNEAAYYETQLLAITRSYSTMKFTEEGTPIIRMEAVGSLLVDVGEDLVEVSAENIKRLNRLREDIRSIESQLDKLEQSQSERYSSFDVEVVISNQGRASTSLRPVALMRVQVSQENYADVSLKMKEYSENAELAAGATKIIRYRSDQIYTFPSDDQVLLNNFWGSTAWFRIYTMNTGQEAFSSNKVAFADNLNQKIILDRLKDLAANEISHSP